MSAGRFPPRIPSTFQFASSRLGRLRLLVSPRRGEPTPFSAGQRPGSGSKLPSGVCVACEGGASPFAPPSLVLHPSSIHTFVPHFVRHSGVHYGRITNKLRRGFGACPACKLCLQPAFGWAGFACRSTSCSEAYRLGFPSEIDFFLKF